MARYASISFPFLLTDDFERRNAILRGKPFVISAMERGRMLVIAPSPAAVNKGIAKGMVVADCKAIFPDLTVVDAKRDKREKLLSSLAEWCISFTPFVSIDSPDGLILDTSGCSHLWGGEQAYIDHIKSRLASLGFQADIGIADTISAAWATARFGSQTIIATDAIHNALQPLPPDALRLETTTLARLRKLGFNSIGHFMDMPASVLNRRFGQELTRNLAKALGREMEFVQPIKPIEPYQQRLSCLEPVNTVEGISIALKQLLESLCARFRDEGIGLRKAIFKAYRIDGDVQQIEIGTVQVSCDPVHLFRLLEHKIGNLQPDLGFELFQIDASETDKITHEQSALWDASVQDGHKISELLDRLAARMRPDCISRYLPDEHHWPERCFRKTTILEDKPQIPWSPTLPRPMHLLFKPEKIEVMVRIPDYPPIQFQYKGQTHQIARADGPERIEQEWWIESGRFRDYYCVEDGGGARFWVFRQGPYNEYPKWFLHGFFA